MSFKIPNHLMKYVVEQNYSAYTHREHATWRYLMRQSHERIKNDAHPSFLQALKKVRIRIDKIPNILELNENLKQFGWQTVCVDGFIPPSAFLEFQALNYLPIAPFMRAAEQIFYTPAPDIFHEVLGHAPLLADIHYVSYLTRYAQVAKKAISSLDDKKFYDSIRLLSDLKQDPNSSEEAINAAVKALEYRPDWTSEAARVARLYWWTAEYGLLGSLAHPKIYGAGLISSMEEGGNCLNSQVEKRWLDISSTEHSYDITRAQPFLYVAKDYEHLNVVLMELEKTFSYKIGSIHGIETAIRAQTPTTTLFTSGLEITGVLKAYKAEESKVCFMEWDGLVHLSYEGARLSSHNSFTMNLPCEVRSVFNAILFEELDDAIESSVVHFPTPIDKGLDSLYARVAGLRNSHEAELNLVTILGECVDEIVLNHDREWLLALELVEVIAQKLKQDWQELIWARNMQNKVLNPLTYDGQISDAIRLGLSKIKTPDVNLS